MGRGCNGAHVVRIESETISGSIPERSRELAVYLRKMSSRIRLQRRNFI
jgi:hypothetical protein